MATKKKPSKLQAKLGNRRLRDALAQAHSLLANRRWDEAVELLVSLDRTYPQQQPVLRYLVDAAFESRDAYLYQYGCERLLALCPRDKDLPFMLTVAYVQNTWYGMALAMGRRALAEDPTNEKAENTRRLLAKITPVATSEIARGTPTSSAHPRALDRGHTRGTSSP